MHLILPFPSGYSHSHPRSLKISFPFQTRSENPFPRNHFLRSLFKVKSINTIQITGDHALQAEMMHTV